MLNKRYTGFRHNFRLLSRLFNFSKLLVKLIKYQNLVCEIILYINTNYKYIIFRMYIIIFKNGPREEDKVADFFVFSHIRMRGNFRLGKG